MNIYRGIDDFDIPRCIVTLGMFDGVHRGHLHLIDELRSLGRDLNLPTTLLTLWPHPRFVLKGDYTHVRLLTTMDEKLELLEKTGVDNVMVLPFTTNLAAKTADHFVRDVLVEKLHASHFLMGYNHHFGSDRLTTEEQMGVCRMRGLTCSIGQAFVLEGNVKCSSSEIRKLLSEGDITTANMLLGREYSITGTVVHGDGIGHKIGFPTANLDLNEPYKQLPGDGVYVAIAEFDGYCQTAVVNIGIRPTLGATEHRIEAHLVDFSAKIYGRIVTLRFVSRIRSEVRFSVLDELESQIRKDIMEAKRVVEKTCEEKKY